MTREEAPREQVLEYDESIIEELEELIFTRSIWVEGIPELCVLST
jgi:hypothetical protein